MQFALEYVPCPRFESNFPVIRCYCNWRSLLIVRQCAPDISTSVGEMASFYPSSTLAMINRQQVNCDP